MSVSGAAGRRTRARRGGALSRYLADIRSVTPLEREEEQEIAQQISGQMNPAAERLVLANLRFVARIAQAYQHLGVPLEDLISEGNIGLMHAAVRYDPDRGLRFITYAVWWVRKAILGAIERHSSTVRIPAYQTRKRAMLRAERGDRSAALPSFKSLSLHEPVSPGQDASLLDELVDRSMPDPEAEIVRRQGLVMLRRFWGCLSSRQRQVLMLRYGLDGRRSLTLKQVGARMGLSRERVRQIQSEAIAKLRTRLCRSDSREMIPDLSDLRTDDA